MPVSTNDNNALLMTDISMFIVYIVPQRLTVVSGISMVTVRPLNLHHSYSASIFMILKLVLCDNRNRYRANILLS